ncbi:MAG: hypothetical protein ACTHWM_05265 [Yaniella sp.]|uniref:hypothetical protein n=1 Tax=Yaniella sp. TaxID=2773929 RepID=UPI003F98FED6
MSIKSLGKIAAVAAVAGLALTACADEDATQARNQEESCGLIQSASLKATESMNSIQATEGSDDRAAFVFESVALDLRNHSFDRSNDEPAPDSDETLKLRTALQVQAEQFQDMSDILGDDVNGLQNYDPSGIDVDGMSSGEATEIITNYCGPVFNQQQQQGGF